VTNENIISITLPTSSKFPQQDFSSTFLSLTYIVHPDLNALPISISSMPGGEYPYSVVTPLTFGGYNPSTTSNTHSVSVNPVTGEQVLIYCRSV